MFVAALFTIAGTPVLEYWPLRISKRLNFSGMIFLPTIIVFWHFFLPITLVGLVVKWLQLYTELLDPSQPLGTVIGLLGTFPGRLRFPFGRIK